MKIFLPLSFPLILFLFSCGSNYRNEQSKVTVLLKELLKNDKNYLTEQQFRTEIKDLKAKQKSILSLLKTNNSVTKERAKQLELIFENFESLSNKTPEFKKNSKARKELLKRVQLLKGDIDKGLGKKEAYPEMLKQEIKNWKQIKTEYTAFIESINKLKTDFNSIQQNLMKR